MEHPRTYPPPDCLRRAVSVVGGLRYPVDTMDRFQTGSDTERTVHVIVHNVGDAHRGGGCRAGGAGGSLRRAPLLHYLVVRILGLAAHQPLGTDLRSSPDHVAIGIIGGMGALAPRIRTLDRASFRIIGRGSGIGDIGARTIHPGQITHGIVVVDGGQVEFASSCILDRVLRYKLVGRVVGSGVGDAVGGRDLRGHPGLQGERREACYAGIAGVGVGGHRLYIAVVCW